MLKLSLYRHKLFTVSFCCLIFVVTFGQGIENTSLDFKPVHPISGVARNQLVSVLKGDQGLSSIFPFIESLSKQDPQLGLELVSELLLSDRYEKYTEEWAILLYYKTCNQLESDVANEELELLQENTKECIIFFEQEKAPFWLARCYSLMSNISFNISYNNDDTLFLEAKNYNQKALNLMLKYQSDILASASILGEIYRIRGNICLQLNTCPVDSVLTYYDLGLEYFSLKKDRSGQANILLNKAITFASINQDSQYLTLWEDPSIYYQEALKTSDLMKDLLSFRLEYAIYLQNKFRETGEEFWTKQSNLQLQDILETSKEKKCEAYFQLAMNQQSLLSYKTKIPEFSKIEYEHLLDSVIYLYEQALFNSKTENNLKVYNIIFDRLSISCPYFPKSKCSKLLSLANEVKTHFIQKNKIINQEITKRNEAFRVAIMAQERSNLKQRFIIIFLAVLGSIGFLFFRFRTQSLKEAIANKQEALRAQMNPHFISNSINAIESLVNQARNEEASEYLIDFSRLCRMVLNHSRDTKITLKEEIEALGHFLSLEKLRLSDDLEYSISIDNQLDPAAIIVPSMLLQPFVENAIWHGIKNKPEPKKGELKIEVKKINAQNIEYIVEDNGVGRAKALAIQNASVVDQKSWGTTLVKERIKYIKNDRRASLEIKDLYDAQQNPVGTKVMVRLPIIQKR